MGDNLGHIPIGSNPFEVEKAIVEDGEFKTPDVSGDGETSGSLIIATGDSPNGSSGDITIKSGNYDDQPGAVSIQHSQGKIGFFGETPVSKQGLGTIDAAAIAAALINLGLCFDDT